MGDINIDINKINCMTDLLLETICKHSLNIMVNFNTMISCETTTKIDHVYTNMTDKIKCEPVLRHRISDHETIKIVIENNEHENDECEYFLSWKDYNKDDLIDNLRKCDWSLFEQSDIDIKLKILRDNLINSVTPLTKYVQLNNKIKPKKWFDNQLRAIKERKILNYDTYARTKNISFYEEYIKTRNTYNKLIKEKKE